MKLSRVLRISRPRFWIYELGPFMIGVLGAILTLNAIPYDGFTNSAPLGIGAFFDYLPFIIIFAVYFLIPANIWIYGINDIYDYETDKLNPKKVEGYEALVEPKEQKSLWMWIILSTVPFILCLPAILSCKIYWSSTTDIKCEAHGYFYKAPVEIKQNSDSVNDREYNMVRGVSLPPPVTKKSFNTLLIISFLAFLFFSGQYSAKPIRAKAKPILDSFFSAGHYIATAAFGYLLVNPTGELNRYYIIAGMAWAMAMHAFSAVPDIQADKDANLATIASLFGGKGTIILCAILYALSGILSYSFLGVISVIISVVYCGLMIAALTIKTEKQIFALYKRFPIINMLSGMVIFFVVLLKVLH